MKGYIETWFAIGLIGSLINTVIFFLEIVFIQNNVNESYDLTGYFVMFFISLVLSLTFSFPSLLIIYLVEVVWLKRFKILLHILPFPVYLTFCFSFAVLAFPIIALCVYYLIGSLAYYRFVFKNNANSEDFQVIDTE
ncbi:MAG: hypothetical protein ACK5FX_04815 [Flavobacteriia bacterium]